MKKNCPLNAFYIFVILCNEIILSPITWTPLCIFVFLLLNKQFEYWFAITHIRQDYGSRNVQTACWSISCWIMDNSYPRQLVPKTIRSQDNSYPGQLVVVLGTSFLGCELSWVWYELTWVRVDLGTSCPGYELSWVRVVQIPSCLGDHPFGIGKISMEALELGILAVHMYEECIYTAFILVCTSYWHLSYNQHTHMLPLFAIAKFSQLSQVPGNTAVRYIWYCA